MSVIESNYTAPPSKVTDVGRCTLILPNNLSALTNKNNKNDVKQAELCMREGRVIARGFPNLSDADKIMCIGKLDVRLALYLTGREKYGDEAKEFGSVAAISQAFVL